MEQSRSSQPNRSASVRDQSSFDAAQRASEDMGPVSALQLDDTLNQAFTHLDVDMMRNSNEKVKL